MKAVTKVLAVLFTVILTLMMGIAIAVNTVTKTVTDIAGCVTSLIAPLPVAIGDVASQYIAEQGQKNAELSEEQLTNAATIIGVGRSMRIPDKGIIIALSAALKESSLKNVLVPRDHDSLGLFQGRPSQGWGTPAQLTDTVFVSRDFFERLQKVPNWQSSEVWYVADQILNPAEEYSRRYQNWVNLATAVLKASSIIVGGEIAVVGDSLTVGIESYAPADLAATGWAKAEIDGKGSRRTVFQPEDGEPDSGISAVRKFRDAGFDPQNWIIALGTNDLTTVVGNTDVLLYQELVSSGAQNPLEAEAFDDVRMLIRTMLDELGSDKRVLWVNLLVQGKEIQSEIFNRVLASLSTDYPNLYIADWSGLAAQNPEWFASDGVHYTSTGYQERSEMIAQSSGVFRTTVGEISSSEQPTVGGGSICDLPSRLLGGALNIMVGQVGQVYRAADFVVGLGTNAAEVGSGFLEWGFNQAGKSLSGLLLGGSDSGVMVVSSSALAAPGDLIIWKVDSSDPDAVQVRGIYLGEGKVIIEPKEGEVIAVSDIDWTGVDQILRIEGLDDAPESGWVSPIKEPYRITSGFGMRLHPIKKIWKLHDGVDMAAPDGTKVYAAFDGTISIAAVGPEDGPFIEITHPDGVMTRYVHLEEFAEGIEVGVEVKAGDYLGFIGDCGCKNSTGTHLHFLLHVNFEPTDPIVFMSEKGVRL